VDCTWLEALGQGSPPGTKRIAEHALGLRLHSLPAKDRKRAVSALDSELIRLLGEDRARRDKRRGGISQRAWEGRAPLGMDHPVNRAVAFSRIPVPRRTDASARGECTYSLVRVALAAARIPHPGTAPPELLGGVVSGTGAMLVAAGGGERRHRNPGDGVPREAGVPWIATAPASVPMHQRATPASQSASHGPIAPTSTPITAATTTAIVIPRMCSSSSVVLIRVVRS
jgi:hypothetical protein